MLELLGEGGMGRVYLAEDTQLGRQVALKLLPAEMSENPERLLRFEREARAVAALNHPGIVTIHSIEHVDGRHFITMERVQGQSLTPLIPPAGLPLERLLPLATQIADALSAAHEAGITHRDLKPDNVMVSSDGRVKILDFGLAKLRQPEPDSLDPSEDATASVTRDGRIVGTVAYMSPEQAQGKPIDPRSDIFSLGILLFEMATGRRPFTGDTNITVLSSILKDAPRPASELRSEIPRPLERLISRALEKAPQDRYQSARDLRQDLENLRRDLESGELFASRHSLPALLRPSRRRPWIAVGLAAVALVAAALALRPDPAPAPTADTASPSAERPSLAVFEFQNLGRDAELDWLRSGLTDMLVTDLSQSPGLRVVDTARLHQLMAEAGGLDAGRHDTPHDAPFSLIQAVARDAGVGTAIVGSFVRAGETLRISARIQDAGTGEVLASESVEGPGGEELFDLVDQLTRRIRARLELARESAGMDRELKEVTTSSLQAYRAFVEGVRLHERAEEAAALPLLERALDLDPGFAMAMAKLSVVHGNLGHEQESREFARRALEHVDRLSDRERLYIEGRYYSLDSRTLERAIAAYAEAVERFPDHTSARNNLAQALIGLGRYQEAIRHLEQLRRDGMTFPGTYESLAGARAAVGEPERGLEVLQDYARQQPDNPTAYLYLAGFGATLGRLDDAERDATRALSLGGDPVEVARVRWTIAILRGDTASAAEQAERVGEQQGALGAALAAMTWAWRGDVDRAVAEMGKAATQPGYAQYGLGLLAPALLLEAGRAGPAARLLDAAGAAGYPKDPLAPIYARSLRALAASRLGDAARVRSESAAARAELSAVPAELVREARPNVEGLLALAEGRRAEARRQLEESIGLAKPNPMNWDMLIPRTAGVLASMAREDGDAAVERAWLERLESSGAGRLFTPLVWVRGQYRLAELLEGAGEPEAAAAHYRTFLRYWESGSLDREQVAEARRRLAALGTRGT